jgi:anti-anti-sigma factor
VTLGPRQHSQAQFDVQWHYAGLLICMVGELDVANAAALAEVIEKAAAIGRLPVVLDMSAVSFIDASIMGVLGRAAARHARPGNGPGILIDGADDFMVSVMRLVDLDHLLAA